MWLEVVLLLREILALIYLKFILSLWEITNLGSLLLRWYLLWGLDLFRLLYLLRMVALFILIFNIWQFLFKYIFILKSCHILWVIWVSSYLPKLQQYTVLSINFEFQRFLRSRSKRLLNLLNIVKFLEQKGKLPLRWYTLRYKIASLQILNWTFFFYKMSDSFGRWLIEFFRLKVPMCVPVSNVLI